MAIGNISDTTSSAPPEWRGLLRRRDMLRVGSLALASSMLPAGASIAGAVEPRGQAKSVVFLWMGGGVTHIESFDPKPDAPETVRGELKAISTALPGVQFNEPMPHLAAMAKDLCVVRSFSHDSNDHLLSQVYTLSGRKVTPAQLFSEPNLGSIVSHLYGPRNGLPGYIAVPGITRPGPPPHNLFVGGWLGGQYAPFCVGGQPLQPDFTVGKKLLDPPPFAEEELNPRDLALRNGVTLNRIDRRAKLRASLDKAAVAAEEILAEKSMDGHYQSALHLLTSERVRGAFDVSKESPSTRDRYGRTKIGGRCLLARRLVEAGARFVMVDYGYDNDYGNLWDIHNAAGQNFPHVSKMVMRGYNLVGCDRAFAALISDLKTRGLLDTTLVVFLTEFGRTPKINSNGGRDHWGACGSIFFTGAGTKVGQVVGASDNQAAYPVTRPYGPADIAATIFHAMGIDSETRLYDREMRPHPVLDHGVPIPEVFGL